MKNLALPLLYSGSVVCISLSTTDRFSVITHLSQRAEDYFPFPNQPRDSFFLWDSFVVPRSFLCPRHEQGKTPKCEIPCVCPSQLNRVLKRFWLTRPHKSVVKWLGNPTVAAKEEASQCEPPARTPTPKKVEIPKCGSPPEYPAQTDDTPQIDAVTRMLQCLFSLPFLSSSSCFA